MIFEPAESTLTTGDYHRLGVRESEARVRVIRHAAHQLAEPLVRRHLEAPDGQTESDLVEAVTSTYRLLDPRRRATAVERALLTQQEPVRAVEPLWAHPKALARRKEATSDPSRFNAVSFESIPANGSALFPEPSPPRPPESPLGTAFSQLTTYYEHLLRYRPTSWRRSWYFWAAPAVFLLLLLAIRPMLKGGGEKPVPPLPAPGTAEASENAASSDNPAPTEPKPMPSASSTRQADQPMISAPEPVKARGASLAATETPTPVGVPGDMVVDDEPAAIDASNRESSVTEPVNSERAGSAEGGEVAPTPDVQPDDVQPEQPQPAETRSEESQQDGTQPQDDQPEDTTADKKAADVSGDEQETAAPQQQIGIKPLAAPPRRAPLPSPAELEESQSRLRRLLVDRPEPVTETQQMREVEWLLDLRNDSPPGSADALAIAQFVVAKLVSSGRYEQAAAIVDELEGQYDAEDSQLGLSTTEQLIESAGSLANHRRIVAWCLMLSEKYFQAELFDGATEITRLGTLSAVKLGDADLRSRLSQHRDAISTARRTSESVWTIIERSSPGSATATEAAQAGRYLCLMIRDWDQGVPWLANSSDSRLAAVAQQELLLNELADGSVDAEDDRPALDGGTVAGQWLEASDRFRGRLGESVKLHAYELISRAMEESAGLRTLELKKQRDTLREQLPEDLLPSPAETAPAANRLAGAAGGQQPVSADSGVMEGRLMLNGRDTGALIRYPPGVQLSQKSIDQIFRALQQPAAPWTFTFEGVFRLEKAATIRFIAVGPTAPDGDTRLSVNRNRLVLADGVRGRSATADLAGGVHRVTWQISGTDLDEAFVLLQDEVSGDRLELIAPPADRNPLPVRFRIDIQRAR